MTDAVAPLRRALISVSDKTGLEDFARALAAKGVELLSTGGTARALSAAGIPVRDVAEVTGFPEMMDGRVKTLHPRVHGGLLALRGNADHEASISAHDIPFIDLLVVNLYPFEATLESGAGFDDCVENIDIGGPAMIRGASKNHAHVAVVVEPADYPAILADLDAVKGTTASLRRRLAAKAFARTASYDAAISTWLQDVVDSEPRAAEAEVEAAPPAFAALGGQGTVELMCHPGWSDPALAAISTYAAGREEELAVFTVPGLADRLAERGVTVVSAAALGLASTS